MCLASYFKNYIRKKTHLIISMKIKNKNTFSCLFEKIVKVCLMNFFNKKIVFKLNLCDKFF